MTKVRSTFAALTLALALIPSTAWARQTIFVVRHAERADDGKAPPKSPAQSMTNAPADPDLSAAGRARATKLAAMLGEAGIKAIYVTEFKRTQETAQPLATKLGIKPEVIASKDTAALVARVRSEHPKDTVLIVGHSNSIPDIVKAFTGKIVTIGEQEYTAMFVLTPGTGAAALIRW